MSWELGVTDGAFDRTIEEDVVDQAINEMTSDYRGPYLRIHHAPWAKGGVGRDILRLEVNGHHLTLNELMPGLDDEAGFSSEELPYELHHHHYNEGTGATNSRERFHHLSQALRRFAELVEEQKF